MLWGGELLLFRILGAMRDLLLSQIAMLDLATLLTVSCLYTALILPSLWLQIPIVAAATFLSAACPEYAELLGAVISPADMITSILAWHREVNARIKAKQASGTSKTPT